MLGETLCAAVDGQPEPCYGFYAYRPKFALEVVEDRRVCDLAIGGPHYGLLLASDLPIAETPLLPVDLGLALAALHIARVDALNDGVGVPGDGKDLVRFRAVRRPVFAS